MADLTIDVDTRGAVSAIDDLKGAIAGLISGIAIKGIMDFSDSITNLQNRLVALNPNLDETNKQFKAIAAIAFTTRAPLETVGNLYSLMARNAEYLGLSQRQTAGYTETLSKMLALSGMSAGEASGPLLQFGQALASGKFQGDELRSILEGFPILAQAIADKLGVSTGALKKLGSEGKIGVLDVLGALDLVAPKVDEATGRLNITFSGAFNTLKTASAVAFDQFEKNTDTGKILANSIEYIAVQVYKFSESIDKVIGPLTIFFKILASLAVFTAVGRVFQLIGAAILPLIELVFTAGRSFSYAVQTVLRFRDSVAAGAVTLSEFNGVVKFVLAPLASLVALLVEGAAAVYTWLGLDDLIEKFKSLGDSNSAASQEVEDFKKKLREQNGELDDTAKKSKAAADQAEELRKKLAQFKFETNKTVQNFDEMVRSSLQTRNNVVDLQMAQGKLTDITKDEFEIQDGINKFLDQRKGILTNLEDQVKKVKLDQALKIGDPKENAGKLAILNAAIKEVRQSSEGYISALTGVIEKEQQLRRLQFIRANDIKTFQAEVDQAKELASALGVIYDAESAAEKASLGRIESLRKGNELTDAKYRLEKALIGVNQIDADLLRKTFDLYQKQQDAIDQVGRTANLTAEARANEEQRIRQETQKSIDLAVEQAADAKTRQQDFSLGWNEAFRQYAEDAANANKRGAESFQFFSRSVEDAFVNLTHGIKSAVKSLVNSVVVELARIAARQTIAAASGIGGGGLGLLGGIGKFLGFGGGSGGFSPEVANATGASIFATGFAAGGPVMANRPVMVGERGPEMFLPTSAGSIIPNNQLGGQAVNNNTNVTYNINAVDASSFRSLVARDPQFIYNITEVGRRSTPQRSV